MRYEDASHTAFQGNEPIARDDSDALPAGTRGPATGNLISGEGTQTGSAGADQAAGAHITSIAGKGGEDSSFAGGKLSVTGEFGKLSVDADGNYSYMANGGVENVRDRFVYTLADNQGNSDTAALIVEIGKTPVVIKAGAQQIVPGPDGVVTLPPGVQLSDVMVVGRNLVVNLPDGTQLVIIDGAIFVPQLVLDGVEVPATNLAALLIGQEPQPAAGEGPPQSSGGNFDVPVPPLDPGVPLGDLIPPTEYDYTPPEPEEIGQVLDRDPEAGTASAQLDDDAQAGGIAGGVGDDPGTNTASGSLPGSGGDGSLEWALLASGELPVGFSFAAQPNGDVWIMQGGTHVLTVSVDPSNGDYTVTQVAPIDHPAGGDENNLDFVINYSVTDQDGDTAIGSLTINVDDDTPTIDITAASDANVVLTTQDAQTDGDPTATDTATTAAHFGGIFGVSSAFGADGAGSVTTSYALSTTGGASGLSSHGAAINLYLIGGVVVGSTAASAAAVNAGNTIFDVSVDANGVVTLNQYQQIDHTNTDPSPTGPGYEDQLISLADGAISLTRNGSITDGDGDTVTDSASVGIGANIRFADDGPTIDPTLNEVGAAIVDESAPVEAATIPLVGGFTAGDDPHLSGGLAIGKGSTSGAVIDANAAFGADGPANGGGISYSLDVLNAVSGLTTTEGVAINLVELANGVVVGVVDGTSTVAFAIQINAGTGVVTVEQYLSLFHPDSPDEFDEPVFLNEGSLGVRVTASDFDGDSVTSDAVDITSLIRFEDDGPSIDPELNANATVTVDESLPSNDPGINTGAIVKGNDPDLAGGVAIGQANSGVAIVNADAVFGADGPAAGGGISYALSITNSNPGVTLTDGTSITMQLVNGVIVGVVDSGPFDGQAAFAISINPATGVVTVEQYLSLDHPVNPNPNDPLGLGDNTVAVTVTATDGDGDQIESDAVDISGQITFLDDGPSVNPTLNAQATVTVDETLPSNDPGINTGGIVKGNDPDLAGGIAIGQANSGAAIVNANAVFGADGPGANGGLSYALTLGVNDTPLTLTDGSTITLQLVGGVVVGVVDNGPFAGQAAFAIAINPATGVVTVEQYLSLDHPVNPNPNDPLGIGANTVGVTVTATDGDGDPVTSGAVDISGQITFLDDGPTIDPVLDREATVTVDESLPSNDPGINTGAIVKGNDPDLAGGIAIGQANSGSAIVDANAVFGADGPAAGGGISYQLSLGANDTSLTLTDGSTITLQLVGGVVVGVVDNGPFAGQAAFAIAINPATGVVTVEQYLSLDHPVNPNPNDPLGLGDDTVSVTVTATDGDGDAVTSGAIDISDNITFLDDGPSVDPVVNANATVTVDESLPSNDAGINTGGIVKGNDPDLADTGGIAIGQANSGAAIVNANAVFGADGAAAGGGISYALSITNTNPGVTLTDGTPIVMQLVGGVIVGVVNGGPFNGQAAFAIAINSTTGVVTVEQYLSLDHPVNPNPNDPLGLGENVIGVTVTATDGDGDPVTSGAVDISDQITFLDDGPTANDDSANQVGEDNPVTVNVLANDVEGADGVTNSAVSFVPGTLTGTGGLVYNGDGTFTYTPGAGESGTVTFDYQILDGDGDPSVATVTINLGADSTPQVGTPENLIVDEDGLPGANVDSAPLQSDPGETNSTENDTDSGTVVVNFGNDVPNAPLTDSIELLDSPALDGQLVDLDGNPVTFALVGGQLIGSANGTQVMIISVTGAVAGPGAGEVTYTYQAELLQPVQHADVGNNENTDILSGVQFRVTDSDGDVSAPSSFSVTVVDDVPSLENVQPGSTVTLDETNGTPGNVPGTFPISATSAGAVISATQVFGADGAAAANSVVYGLSITNGSPEPSGLFTAVGNFPITLVQIDADTIQGQYDGSNVAFTIQMNANGTVTLTQNVPLEHNTDSGPAPTGHNDSLDLTGLINATVTITDGDGDTASDSAPIGDNLVFLDDGPDAQVDGQATLDQLVLDETRPLGQETDGDSDPAGLGQITANFANNFVAPIDYGADGAGSVSYSLALSGSNVGSGLYALDATDIIAGGDGDGIGRGAEIVLNISPDGLTITGSVGLTNYFTIQIDPGTGVVTFTQLNNIWHGSTASDDDTATLTTAGAANVQVVQRVTDSDGDFDTAAVNVGQGVFHIEDDGPEFTADPIDAVVENGDTTAVISNLNIDIGTDGFGLLFFNQAHDGDPAQDADGNNLTFGGEQLFYQVNGNVLTAETADGDIGFTITLNQNGTYSFQLHGTISNGTETSFTNLTSSAAGNVEFRLIGNDTAVNNEANTDIILSGRSSDGSTGSVNTNSTAIGVDNQSVNPLEQVRIDFVENLETIVGPGDPPNGPQGFHHSGHVETNHFEQLIAQTSGNADTLVDLRVTAILADNDHVYDNNPQDGIEAGEAAVDIVSVTVTFAFGQVHTFDANVPASLSFLHTNADGSGTSTTTVTFNADGSVTIAGLQEGDVYEIDTTDPFSAVNVANVDTGGDSFDLGIFSIGTTSTGDPIVQDFDIVAQDRDGDQEASTITTTINPPAEGLALSTLAAGGQDEQVQRSAANSNTMTVAAAVAAAGMAESAAAAPENDQSSLQFDQATDTSSATASNEQQSVEGGDNAWSFAALPEAEEADAGDKSNGKGNGNANGHDAKLDDSSSHQSASDESWTQAADDQGPSDGAEAPVATAPAVMMVSAEALKAADLEGKGDDGGDTVSPVEQVLAEALGQGAAPTVDDLLAGLPGGAVGALHDLTSPAFDNAPAWDMGAQGSFANAADMLIKMGADATHHDAVQPVVNG